MNAARQRLIDAGLGRVKVSLFPAAQVILVDEKREFEVRRDDRVKLLGLPILDLDTRAGAEEPASDGDNLFADLLPRIVKLRRTQARLEQQVAVLRHVEGLRIYAAGYGGRLPSKLSEVPVPLPLDPATGKPFQYEAEGATAHLRGGPLSEHESAVHYVVTLVK